ncbi:hypothetical protein PAAG_11089 [Paracoccidioides lutzii Pb01]|uniref:Uncharacterized protein n=1 Tax=Paracoccidioides lutzii (strain ATCC MYA-826 / Pb01) TaxID=502779 RepID=A0A0A2V3T7_PARBA|nr:hypothetical protein PAAG_11089 [Paracoccidioides lutzii Pb01]KGQ02138.1 hypothetical protein PAAG_11089 [Paracoccidioides lutzii Pb01]
MNKNTALLVEEATTTSTSGLLLPNRRRSSQSLVCPVCPVCTGIPPLKRTSSLFLKRSPRNTPAQGRAATTCPPPTSPVPNQLRLLFVVAGLRIQPQADLQVWK